MITQARTHEACCTSVLVHILVRKITNRLKETRLAQSEMSNAEFGSFLHIFVVVKGSLLAANRQLWWMLDTL